MINTRVNETYNANNVVNPNDLRKRLINVDSKFRTNPSDPVGNFQYRLEHTYKNVIRLRVASVEIPNTFYTFSAARQNLSFQIATQNWFGSPRVLTITLEEGNYTTADLVEIIQNQMNDFRDATGIFLGFKVNVYSGKVTIENQGVSNLPTPLPSGATPTLAAKPTVISFANVNAVNMRHKGLGLAYNLGFRKLRYEPAPTSAPTGGVVTYSITSEAMMDIIEDQYLLLGVNDFHTVEHRTDTNYYQELAKVIVREAKMDIIYDDGASCVSNEIVFPRPQDLSVLQISLRDAYGCIVDLNGLNYSITLEITEVLNTNLYDFYRNYIWLGTIPSVPVNKISSAGSTLLKGIGPPF